ncbi:hypothetical protein [Mesorhizobium sp.]|uniref:hypothetical protein n=1 Tax=Mesorhizobium sp. TaxID=1871066 RepID=UPI000FE46F3A|nr:hypothetical protein [Mesorhizobium sp.]RWE44222.1 MAG: hypothetical protein EOS80_19985 [Mesorhizobium sp.]
MSEFQFWSYRGPASDVRKFQGARGLHTGFTVGAVPIDLPQDVPIANGDRVRVIFACHKSNKSGQVVRFVNATTGTFSNINHNIRSVGEDADRFTRGDAAVLKELSSYMLANP